MYFYIKVGKQDMKIYRKDTEIVLLKFLNEQLGVTYSTYDAFGLFTPQKPRKQACSAWCQLPVAPTDTLQSRQF